MLELAFGDTMQGKIRSVAAWVRRKLGAAGHEERVAQIAATLFDLTSPWHRLGTAERSLLVLGALVHDVGRAVSKDGHEKLGAHTVLTDERLLLGEAERRRVAFLTRYHRGPVPEKGAEQILRDGDDRKTLRRMLAFLRAADGLDSRWMQSPQLVFAVRQRQIDVLCYLHSESDKACLPSLKRKKFRLLEEELGCRVSVDLRLNANLSLVA